MIRAMVHFLRQKTSISFRIYAYSLSIFLMLMVFMASAFYGYFHHIKGERIQFINFTATEILVRLAEKGLRRGNPDLVADTFDTLIERSEITYLQIVDSQSETFFASGVAPVDTSTIYSLSNPIYSDLTVSRQTDVVIDTHEITKEKRLIGTLMIHIDTEQIAATAWKTIRNRTLLSLLLLVVVCLCIAYIIGQSLVRPLRHIMSDLAKFQQGEYEFQSKHTPYIDEYAKLSSALGDAGKAIVTAHHEINVKNHALKEQVIQLTEARKSADEANARKDVFVKNMTHELKTPLAGATSGNDLLEGYLYDTLALIDSEEQNTNKLYKIRELLFNCIKAVDISNQGTSQINTLIDNILLSIQDISDSITINNHPHDIRSSLQGLCDYYSDLCKRKNLALTHSITIPENTMIQCDWQRLSQILHALLSNAVKYTNEGVITFNADILIKGKTIKITFEIIDSGIGIADKEKENIFHLFHIAQAPENKCSAGIGTGLATAKRLAECLGGQLFLKESSIGMGSCFVFDCEFSVLPENHSSTHVIIEHNEHHYAFLYVEDSYLNQTIFKEYCNGYNIDLTLAHNGKQGFEKYKLNRFDAIIIDCYMPIMNGFQLIEKIRTHESLNNLPRSLIIALTADNSDQNRHKCEQYGFDLFITKPYNRHNVEQIITMVRE